MDTQPFQPDTLPPPLGPADIERWAGSRPVRRQNRPHQMMQHRTKGGWPDTAPIFWAPYTGSSVSNLGQNITINGVTVSPSLRYEGKDATPTQWPAVNGLGPTLLIDSTGTDPTSRDTPLISAADRGVGFGAGKVYRAAAADSAAEIDLEDCVIELYMAWGPTPGLANSCVVGTANAPAGAGLSGWSLWAGTSGATAAVPRFSDGATVVAGSATVTIGGLTYSLVHVLCDRNENSTDGLKIYVNGVLSTSVNPFALNGISLISGRRLTIGGSCDLNAIYKLNGQDVVYVALYKRSDWFAGGATNASQWLEFARTRTAYLAGTVPSVAYGTAAPTIQTRNSSGFSDKIDPATGIRKMFYCGPNWPRLCYRKEVAGGEYQAGLLMEYTSQTRLGASCALDNAVQWPVTNLAAVTEVLDSPWYSPYTYVGGTRVREVAWALKADATLGQHYVSTSTAWGAGTYVTSIWAKAGSRAWLKIESVVDAKSVTFDLANGVVGTTVGAVSASGVENWGNGWLRCWMHYVSVGSAAGAFRFSAATDTADSAYSGDGSTAISVFGPQHEARLAQTCGIGPSALIPTSAGLASRGSDRLEYTLNPISFPITMEAEVLNSANMSTANTRNGYAVVLSNASGAAFSSVLGTVVLGLNNASPYAGIAYVYSGAGQQAAISGTTNALNGERNKLACSANTNLVKYSCNDVQEGSTDVAATMPTLNTPFLQVGNDQGGTYSQPSYALISNVKIFPVLKF